MQFRPSAESTLDFEIHFRASIRLQNPAPAKDSQDHVDVHSVFPLGRRALAFDAWAIQRNAFLPVATDRVRQKERRDCTGRETFRLGHKIDRIYDSLGKVIDFP